MGMVKINIILSLVFSLSIANDDQYASNVPDTHHQSEDRGCVAVDESVKVNSSRGERSGDNNSPAVPPPVKELEIRYLSQLRQSPFLINGIYKIYHQSANNHFRRHADIKHRGKLSYNTPPWTHPLYNS